MAWFTRFAIRQCFPAASGLPGAADTGLRQYLRAFRREAPFLMRLGLFAGTWTYMLTPVFTVWIPLPAFLLPAGVRERHTERICAHRVYLLRSALLTLKMVGGMCWGRDPEVRKRLGATMPLPPDPDEWREGVAP